MSGPGGVAGAVSGEGYVGYWEKALPSESGLAVEQATQGMVTTPRLPEFKECWTMLSGTAWDCLGVLCRVTSLIFPSLTLSSSQCWHVPSHQPSPEHGWAELAQPEVIHIFNFLSSGCGVSFWLYFNGVRRNFSPSYLSCPGVSQTQPVHEEPAVTSFCRVTSTKPRKPL